MTQEQKDLLLKDLCARLPYGVMAKFGDSNPSKITNITQCIDSDSNSWFIESEGESDGMMCEIDNVKPFLFPLSNMTEEQIQEYTYIVNYISSDDTENWVEGEFIYVEQFTQLMHFYHTNHLDYMGFIPMGLAIDATGLNIY